MTPYLLLDSKSWPPGKLSISQVPVLVCPSCRLRGHLGPRASWKQDPKQNHHLSQSKPSPSPVQYCPIPSNINPPPTVEALQLGQEPGTNQVPGRRGGQTAGINVCLLLFDEEHLCRHLHIAANHDSAR